MKKEGRPEGWEEGVVRGIKRRICLLPICLFPTEFLSDSYLPTLELTIPMRSESFGMSHFFPKNFRMEISKIPRKSEVQKFRRQPYQYVMVVMQAYPF